AFFPFISDDAPGLGGATAGRCGGRSQGRVLMTLSRMGKIVSRDGAGPSGPPLNRLRAFEFLLRGTPLAMTKAKTKAKPLLKRSKVKPQDTWDLGTLFKRDAEWEAAFAKWEKQIPGY